VPLSRAWTVWALFAACAANAAEQRIKVEGVWEEQRIVVHRVQQRDPGKDAQRIRIAGEIRWMDYGERRMRIGPAELLWSPAEDDFVAAVGLGDSVLADARRLAEQRFQIVYIRREELEADNAIELIGTITGSEVDGAENRIELAGIPTWVPRRLYSNGRIRLQRLDDKRPAEQLTFNVGETAITLGGEFGWTSAIDGDRDLRADDDDDEVETEASIELEAFFEFGDRVSMFVELDSEVEREAALPSGDSFEERRLRRGESWVYIDEPFDLPFGLQIGRQNFAEEREWWWDEDLDAIRAYFGSGELTAEMAVARELGDPVLSGRSSAAEARDVQRLIATARWRRSSALDMQAFFLDQQDSSTAFEVGEVLLPELEDEEDADSTWLGGRVSGDIDLFERVEFRYWADVAVVDGSETRYEFDDLGDLLVTEEVVESKREGSAFDFGASFTWRGRHEPTLTLGLARGDESFRQTGINDNNNKYNGVDRFRYYGELTRPELSNLAITTVGVGFRLGRNSSLELLHHRYAQLTPSVEHGLRIDPDATGLATDLGQEIDIVLGLEEWEHLELEFVGGFFAPGPALSDRDTAWLATAKVNYNF